MTFLLNMFPEPIFILVACRKEGLASFRTNQYKMNYYETASGLKFILNTDLAVSNIRDILHQMYSQVILRDIYGSILYSQ